MLKAKQQGVLLLTAPSHPSGQGPAAPKTTPENNSPGDGETCCSSLAQLSGSGPPPGRCAAGLAGENKGISGVKRLRLKSLRVAAEEPAPAVCTRRAGWEVRDAGYCLVVSVPCLPPAVAQAQSSPKRGVKASTFVPSWCLTRGSHRSGTRRQPEPWWAQTPPRKYRPGRSLEGGIGHFTLTLPLVGKMLGSSPPEEGPNLVHHLEKSPVETPSLLKAVGSRRLASSSGSVSN